MEMERGWCSIGANDADSPRMQTKSAQRHDEETRDTDATLNCLENVDFVEVCVPYRHVNKAASHRGASSDNGCSSAPIWLRR
jgi:hypothetical protein